MEKFLELIANVMEVPVNSISLETTRESLEVWDSLMQLRITGELEDVYKISIPLEEVSKLDKLEDFYKYVAGKE